MSTLITFTPAAAEHIKNVLAKTKDKIGFRLSLKKTGCSGFSYASELVETVNTNDIHFEVHNLHVFVDPACEQFVKDLVIDYVIEAGDLKQKKLIYLNPNERNRCGCGESFTIE